jgi:glycosyltransferase involved in cell wall biosynthesis
MILNQYSGAYQTQFRDASVAFVIGSLAISGGTNMILEYAKGLKEAGANVSLIYLIGDEKDAKWHPLAKELEFISILEADSRYYDLVIATWWPTVFELGRLKFSTVAYFVQSLESRFSIEPADIRNECLAAATYLVGIPVITVSSWLQNLLMSHTQTPTWLVLNGLDKSKFPVGTTTSRPEEPFTKKIRVLVEGHREVPLKALDRAVDAVRAADCEVELWHASPSKNGGSILADRIFEETPHDQMYEIYRQVDLIVKMSRVEGMFGPPLEAFHAGASAIVSKVTGYSDYIRPGENAIALDVDDFNGLTLTLEHLASNPKQLDLLKKAALETARTWPSIENSRLQFNSICMALMSGSQIGKKFKGELVRSKEKIESSIANGLDPRQFFNPLLVTSRL